MVDKIPFKELAGLQNTANMLSEQVAKSDLHGVRELRDLTRSTEREVSHAKKLEDTFGDVVKATTSQAIESLSSTHQKATSQLLNRYVEFISNEAQELALRASIMPSSQVTRVAQDIEAMIREVRNENALDTDNQSLLLFAERMLCSSRGVAPVQLNEPEETDIDVSFELYGIAHKLYEGFFIDALARLDVLSVEEKEKIAERTAQYGGKFEEILTGFGSKDAMPLMQALVYRANQFANNAADVSPDQIHSIFEGIPSEGDI